MLKKIIFLVFRNSYRYSSLGNFGKSNKYGDVLLISLGGRFKSFIGKILYYLKIGKFISIDGDPFLKIVIFRLICGSVAQVLRYQKNIKDFLIIM